MELITRDEILGLSREIDSDKIARLSGILTDAAKQGDSSVNLYFDQWGYEWEDIQFVIDAGYIVERNGACLWWEVSW